MSRKRIHREPTPDDPRRCITRTPDEMRSLVMHFRISKKELDDLYQYARSHRATMSYMVREALKLTYPDIFSDANRHIRKPKLMFTPPSRTTIQTSLNDGRINIDTMD